MVTKINIRIDSREWNVELAGRSTPAEIQAAIKEYTDAYPVYTKKYISVVQHGWLYDHLAPIADGWLAVNPIVRFGCYFVGAAMFGVAVYLNM